MLRLQKFPKVRLRQNDKLYSSAYYKMKKDFVREVVNGTTMIPGIILGMIWFFRNQCGVLFPTTYVIFSTASMIHHLHTGFIGYNHTLLRIDLLTQQASAISIIIMENDNLRLVYAVLLTMLSLLVNLKRRRKMGYAINGFLILVVADIYQPYIRMMCLSNIIIFLYGAITKSVYAHGVFHLFAHYITMYATYRMCG